MYKSGDQLELTNKPQDMPHNWEILGCFFRQISRTRALNCLMVVRIDGRLVDTTRWNVNIEQCKPRLKKSAQYFNFKFGRTNGKVQEG